MLIPKWTARGQKAHRGRVSLTQDNRTPLFCPNILWMAPDWRAAMLSSELSSCLPHLWIFWKVPLSSAEGKCQGYQVRTLQSILWWTPKLLFLRKVHYSFNEQWGRRWAAKPLARNGWASAPHNKRIHTNSYEFAGGKWLTPRNVGKTVERGQHLTGASGTQGDQTQDETWLGAWNEKLCPRCNSKDCKTHLFGCLVPSHSVLHLPSMDGQTMFPTPRGNITCVNGWSPSNVVVFGIRQ